jgi:hypothetical protein
MVVTHDAFASFGAGFGSFEALDSIQLTCLSIPILSGIGLFYYYALETRFADKQRSGLRRSAILCLPHKYPVKIKGNWFRNCHSKSLKTTVLLFLT